jgi:hypothetical protein
MSRREKVFVAFAIGFETVFVKLLADQTLRTLPIWTLLLIGFAAGCALAALVVYARRGARRTALHS